MTQEQSVVSRWVVSRGNTWITNLQVILGGAGLISLLAQISIPLPWTPVPITGQTFGVTVMALLWGKKRGTASVFIYLTLGAMGLPIFALGQSGLSFGPTLGYLVGMLASSFLLGALADRGWTQKTFFHTWGTATLGSLLIFAFGLLGLSFFVPRSELLMAGMIPFLPGDLIKNLLATTAVTQIQRLQSLESR